MKYIVQQSPIVEATLVSKLSDYLHEKLRIEEFLPNSGTINVSALHPFVELFDVSQSPEEIKVTDLFPSVTIIETDTTKIVAMNNLYETRITAEEVTEWASKRIVKEIGQYYITPETIAALTAALVEEDWIPALGMGSQRSSRVSIEIWADNIVAKNMILDFVMGFVSGEEADALYLNDNIMIKKPGIRASRSGNYNYDFGKTLYGGAIEMEVESVFNMRIYDTDLSVVSEIDHYKENVHGQG
jgi:hypothetical protein